MATERLAPDALLVASNLSGAVTAIQDDPDSPDTTWLTTTSAGASDCRVSFPSPSGPLTTGAGLQNFRAQIRKNASAGNNPGWSLELWENGASVAVLATGTLTTTNPGSVVSGTFDATGRTAANIECRLLQTSGHTGGTSNRRYIEIGAIEWNVTYTPLSLSAGALTSDGVGAASFVGASLGLSSGSFTIAGAAANAFVGQSITYSSGAFTMTGAASTSLVGLGIEPVTSAIVPPVSGMAILIG